MVVSALCRAVYRGAVDTRDAVDAVLAAMEVPRAGARPISGKCNAGCGPAGNGGIRGTGDCDASDSRSDSGKQCAGHAKGKHREAVVKEGAWTAHNLC